MIFFVIATEDLFDNCLKLITYYNLKHSSDRSLISDFTKKLTIPVMAILLTKETVSYLKTVSLAIRMIFPSPTI